MDEGELIDDLLDGLDGNSPSSGMKVVQSGIPQVSSTLPASPLAPPTLEPSLKNIIDKRSLRWVFVGGKGGVGKTTTSCSLAAELSRHRSKVLVISTDPAHNLSDAFDQKFGKEPTLVHGFDNLYCMEIDPKASMRERSAAMDAQQKAAASSGGQGGGGLAGMLGGMGLGSIAKDIGEAIPGIDEALAFGELLKSVVAMEHEVIVFDTAPTGHTLRMLQFPDMIRKATGIVTKMEKSMGGLFQMAKNMMGGGAGGGGPGGLFGQLGAMQGVVDRVSEQFKDPSLTTFVAVCIPEFLSVYETERLVQELGRQRIDCRSIVVN